MTSAPGPVGARTRQHIDNLRGLACLLLVLYHVVGDDPRTGLTVANGPIRLLNDSLAYLRMPLFTFLSGLVYGMRPFSGDSRRFLMGKVRRLMIPLLVVGTLFALLQAITPNAHDVVRDWSKLHLNPVAHYWYLESLMWIFLLIWALDKHQFMDSARGFTAVWVTAAAVYLSNWGTHWLGLGGEIYLFPYFLAGLAVARFELWQVLARPWVLVALIVPAVAIAWALGAPVPDMDRRTAGVLALGVLLCVWLLGLPFNLHWLTRVGKRSYTVFLFHVFFTAATRIALHRLDINNLGVHMALGLAAGILGPMVVDAVASQYRWPALLLLGKTLHRPAAPHPAAPSPP